MKLFQSPQDRDDELLSAYLDNELSPSERARLESRLKSDSRLRATLQGHRLVKTHLGALPKLKLPRNFTLTPKMAGQPARQPSRLIPALNWATTIAAILFATLIATDLLAGFAPRAAVSEPSVAQAPAEGFMIKSSSEVADAANAQASTTATAAASETEALQLAPPAAESSGEPLPGAPALGGSLSPSASPTAQAAGGDLSDTTESAVDGYGETTLTPTPESSLRALATEESPTPTREPTAMPTRVETPASTEVAFAQPPAAYVAFYPIRLLQVALAVVLIGLITVSFLIRRR